MVQKNKKKQNILKQKRILPYIIGLVLIGIISYNCINKICRISFTNLIDSKITVCYIANRDLIHIINSAVSVEDYSEMWDTCSEFVENDSRVIDICVEDSLGNYVSSYSGNEPNCSNWQQIDENSDLYLKLNKELVSIDDNYTASDMINLELIRSIPLLNSNQILIDGMNIKDYLKRQPIITLPLWIAYPMQDTDEALLILNHVDVQFGEIVHLINIFMVMCLLAVVFFFYYLVTIIVLFVDRKKILHVYYTDPITGGNNWQYFLRMSEKLLKKKNKYNYAVIHLRMEKYRNYCTCYGVQEGEELVESFANTLRIKVGRHEIAAHHEKADFALLLSYESPEELEGRITSLLHALNQTRPDQRFYFSVGICEVKEEQMDPGINYNFAGVARSTISIESEKRIAWYTEKMQENSLWERKVEDDMEHALANKEFQVYLQPKYSTCEETLAAAEALVRWIHPTEGFIPPGRFIPIFEKNGFIIQLDDYMITEVARQQAKWMSEGKTLVPISVNVSRAHFTKEDLAEHICELVDQFNVPHNVIELELTESAFFDDKEVLLRTLMKLKQYGFEISMDDFGAGYSSLNSLKELPLDIVKLDAEFFRGTDEFNRGKLIIEETISLAKRLNMRIVAEGIETREQVDFLADQNCDLIQGYYFAKPMPISEFEERAYSSESKE